MSDVTLSKGIMTFIILLITGIGSLMSVVAYSVVVKETASTALDNADVCLEITERHKDQIAQNRQDIAVTKSQYEEIIRRLDRIEKKTSDLYG